MKFVTRLTLLISFTMLLGATLDVSAEQIPLKAWIHDPVIDSVNVSPDAKHLIGLTLTDVNSAPQVTIWDASNLAADPVFWSPKDVKPLLVQWVNDETFLVYGRQKYDYRYAGRNTKWFRDKIYFVTFSAKKQKITKSREILASKEKVGVQIENLLPLKKDKVLIQVTNLEFASDLYEVDLRENTEKRVYRGSPRNSAITNAWGEVVLKTNIETGEPGTRIDFSYKHPETGEWEVHHSLMAKGGKGLQPVAFDPDGVQVYVVDNTTSDKSVIRKYDLISRKLSEPVFADEGVEATGVLVGGRVDNFGKILGYVMTGAKTTRVFTDEREKALHDLIYSALPKDQVHRISSMSTDGSLIVVRSSGPTEPGAYYLFKNRQEVLPLGREFPYLEPKKLSRMEYVEYKARDGLVIPGYLTKPSAGKPPYPAVVMPHGGPWARDFYGWDLWAQFLANRGYAVLQPQYRGSEGWGTKLWRAGDNEWGQKMQDDKDDGAQWLVEQGIAAKDRIAIYGYSYGGYAAMAAVVRPNSPYQCAIAGAGLSELRTFEKITFDSRFGREFQSATIDGLSPLDHVEDASIPIYIFHGDRDQRVPVDQSRKFYKALEKAGKTVEYNEIPDLWHSLPWWPTHHINVLGNLEEYLAERCGPGGL
ncbi:peptidase S9 [Arenicella chitinivorans]|uniref:Peptidase S9 n=1 Tax=Arenicella chitinivorans TaxID=1329800 RepID=A0A918S0K0_9GAMM|nr:prolyl oligopeptidase family serine peptidase [Arenicella chitinivorans]GHA17687.1 peptidase S9 [Arenicella chitinivorans]